MTPNVLSFNQALAEIGQSDQAERQYRAAALVAERQQQAAVDAAAAQAETERIQVAAVANAARAIQAQTDADLAHEWVELAHRQRDLLAAMSEQHRVPALDRLSAVWYQHEILKHVLPGIVDAPSRRAWLPLPGEETTP